MREESLPATKEDIQRLEDLILSMLQKVRAPRYITVADIAELKGVSPRVLRTSKAYLLPRYGKSAYPGRKCKWDLEEYISWDKIPLEEREHNFSLQKKS